MAETSKCVKCQKKGKRRGHETCSDCAPCDTEGCDKLRFSTQLKKCFTCLHHVQCESCGRRAPAHLKISSPQMTYFFKGAKVRSNDPPSTALCSVPLPQQAQPMHGIEPSKFKLPFPHNSN